MSQVPELEGLEVGFKYLQVVTDQIKLKIELERAASAFESSRDGLPEYIDYQDILEAYKQSKLDHTAAYEHFAANIRNSVASTI